MHDVEHVIGTVRYNNLHAFKSIHLLGVIFKMKKFDNLVSRFHDVF